HYDQSSSQYHITISAPASTDFSDIATGVYITRIILNRIRPVARQILLDTAATIATETGCHPSAWSISSGRRVLGSCNSYRIIRLSIYLLFLPHHLRRYIICHELAHLSEMNHSPAFHRIADKYCNGNERSWATELKTFKWPVMR
ncbi:MAG: M48 family metallopeptidase, partial [Muribaculaceae bacterium]|nr:M48 family metallopeptidase [Muribaculaceae bacterium]